MNHVIDDKWHNIAYGMTCFCVFGGPSVNNVQRLDKLIDENFTFVVNNGIRLYPEASMMAVADNRPVRKFFEKPDGQFDLIKRRSQGSGNITVNYEGNLIDDKPDLIKIIGSQR